MKWVDAAGFTKVVFGLFITKLIHAEVFFRLVYFEVCLIDKLVRHHGAFSDADRTGAACAAINRLLCGELEAHLATMAMAFITWHIESPYS